MPNNSKNTQTTRDQKLINAVKVLLTHQDVQMYLDELEQMYCGFITSEYADHQPTRHDVMTTYGNIKSFLKEIENEDDMLMAG